MLGLFIPHFSHEPPQWDIHLAIGHDLIDVGVQSLELTPGPTSRTQGDQVRLLRPDLFQHLLSGVCISQVMAIDQVNGAISSPASS